MGGNLLKHYNLPDKRLNSKDFLLLTNKITLILNENNIKNILIPSYGNKDSFGDADYLIEFSKKEKAKEWISKLFEPEFIHFNTDVISFPFEGFQIDFIFTKEENWETSYQYFRYSDLGNLIGRTAHSMGLCYGHCGLEFPIRQKLFDSNIDDSGDHVVKTLNLSKNPQEILEFLGYDWNRYCAGFDTLEDVFLYASSTPYFNADNFKLENLNHINRIRNRKRKVFMEFLKWLEENPKHDKKFQFGKKRDWIDAIDKNWPIVPNTDWSVKQHIDFYNKKFIRNRENSLKFNGNTVRDLTGLEGKKLGEVLSSFRKLKSVWEKPWEFYLEENSADTIKKEFLEWYNKSI